MSHRTEKIRRNAKARQAARVSESLTEPALPFELTPEDPRQQVVQVTPKLAERLLRENLGNRTLNPNLTTRLASDMESGRWSYTGDTIKFDTDGILVDGQHRLSAVVVSNTTQAFLVVTGVEPEAKKHMDQGRKRTLSDVLKMEGYDYNVATAAVARISAQWSFGYDLHGNRSILSDAEVLDFFSEHEEHLIAAATLAERYRKAIGITNRNLGLFVYIALTRGVHHEEVDSFLSSIANYQTTGVGDPRAALIARVARARNARESMPSKYIVSVLVRTWNAVKAKENLTRFPSSYDDIPNLKVV